MKKISSKFRQSVLAVALMLALPSQPSRADENGISLWLPGFFGSLAAAPAVPGWSLGLVGYHTSVGASGNVAAARQIQIGQVPATANVSLNANLSARADLLFIAPTYTFATPVLGGQLAIGMIGAVGHLDTSIAGTLTAQVGPIVATRNGVISDSLTGVGDLYPLVTLKWNQGVHNYMVYGFGDIQHRYRTWRHRPRRRIHLPQPGNGNRILRRRRPYLQLQEHGHELSERHRLPF
jgi:hypothetical protein